MTKKTKQDDKEQSKRFVEMARALEVDQREKSFTEALIAVVHKKPSPRKK